MSATTVYRKYTLAGFWKKISLRKKVLAPIFHMKKSLPVIFLHKSSGLPFFQEKSFSLSYISDKIVVALSLLLQENVFFRTLSEKIKPGPPFFFKKRSPDQWPYPPLADKVRSDLTLSAR